MNPRPSPVSALSRPQPHHTARPQQQQQQQPIIPKRSASFSRTSTPSLSRPSSSTGHSRQRNPIPGQSMDPISPTPKKGARRGARVPRAAREGQRSEHVEGGGDGWEDTNTAGEEELFGLLGVVSPPIDSLARGESQAQKGVLAVSKADIEARSNGGAGKNPRRKQRQDPSRAIPTALGDTGPTGSSEGRQMKSGKEPRKANPSSRAALPIQAESATQSESESPPADISSETACNNKSRTRQPKHQLASQPMSALSAQLAMNPEPVATGRARLDVPHPSGSTSTYDFSSLSRSLPSEVLFAPPPPVSAPPFDPPTASDHPEDAVWAAGGRGNARKAGKGKGRRKGGDSEDDSRMWDAPSEPGPAVAEDMTWQQRLGSYPNADSPRSNGASASSGAKKKAVPASSRPLAPSPLNPRPTHSRRSSADALSLPLHSRHTSFPQSSSASRTKNLNVPAQPPAPPSAYPLSSFDTLPPFNPTVNVHRAPQTPAKGGLAKKYAVMELPIKAGSFPRINGAGAEGFMGGMGVVGEMGTFGGGGGLDASKYAGASFHNSPHGRALPKPDMEDF